MVRDMGTMALFPALLGGCRSGHSRRVSVPDSDVVVGAHPRLAPTRRPETALP